MVAVVFVCRLDSFYYVQFLLVVVRHLGFTKLLTTCIGISPDSPKKGASVGPGHMNQREHLQVPVDVAERSVGFAGYVHVPQHIWDSIATPRALSSMLSVEVPRKRLRPEEVAMTGALVRQRHLFILDSDMRGHGRAQCPYFYYSQDCF